jgi:alpha-tubulin suppressor-like RCC1 family protein
VTAFTGDEGYTCAIVAGGETKCWGKNYWELNHDQQATNGIFCQPNLSNNFCARAEASIPRSVIASGTTQISGGRFGMCAVVNGSLQCWGTMWVGSTANGNFGYFPNPTVIIPNNVVAVSVGGEHRCAILTNGSLKCWGGNYLGTGNDAYSDTPVEIIASGVTAVSMGGEHGCALLSNGAVKCWGVNKFGQVGNGNTETQLSPVTVIASGAIAISVRDRRSCALLTGGTLKCWGYQYPEDSSIDHSTPETIIASGVSSVQVGFDNTCVIMDNALKCWGNNTYGNTAADTIRPIPLLVKNQ